MLVYFFCEAESGEVALSQFNVSDFNLIFIDYVLIGMNGLELIEEIRKVNSKATIVMITSMGQDWIQERAFELGADHYILKPYKPEQLRYLVYSYITT